MLFFAMNITAVSQIEKKSTKYYISKHTHIVLILPF